MRQVFTYTASPKSQSEFLLNSKKQTESDFPKEGITVQDLLLSQGYSRRLIIDLKALPDGLTVDGYRVCTPYILTPGQVLTVTLPPEKNSPHIEPVCLPFPIVYEDEHLMILNKPAGMPIHPSQGNHDNSLANSAAWYFNQNGLPFTFRVVNRLDRDTTGLLILAKHSLSACLLSDMMKRREIRRTYLAAVQGKPEPESGVINAPISRVNGSTIERCVDFIHGEQAVTHYQVLYSNPSSNTSLVKLHLETGRTHQIRVHMKYLGFPLLGDFLYHPDFSLIQRQSLHSWKLEFSHPITKEPLAFTAAVPDDMQCFLPEGEARHSFINPGEAPLGSDF